MDASWPPADELAAGCRVLNEPDGRDAGRAHGEKRYFSEAKP
jgi:hypothetical protein